MTTKTTKVVDDLIQRSETTSNFIAGAHAQYADRNKFLSLFWTEKELRYVDFVRANVNPAQLDPGHGLVTFRVMADHPLLPNKAGSEVSLPFRFQAPRSDPGMLFPRHAPDMISDKFWEHRDYFMPLLQQTFADTVDRHLFKKAVSIVVVKCETYEQMRHTFPPIVHLLKSAGHSKIADKVRDIKRAPPGVGYTIAQRAIVKHVSNWFASQVLMNTLQGKNPNQSDTMLCINQPDIKIKMDDEDIWLDM